MSDAPSRMFGLVCLLILVWVGVYWFYQPRGAGSQAQASPAAAPFTVDPRPAEPVPVRVEPETTSPPPPTAPPPEPAPAPQPPPKPTTRVVPPEFRSYVVQHGDVSFEVIAERLYKDRKKWGIIARANPFVTSDRLKPGRTVLNIPVDPDNIQGKVVTEGSDAVPVEAAPAGKETTYVVQRDDTLWNIAKKVYKRGSAWRYIYEANRDVIKDPDRPTPGAVLKIPPAPPGG